MGKDQKNNPRFRRKDQRKADEKFKRQLRKQAAAKKGR